MLLLLQPARIRRCANEWVGLATARLICPRSCQLGMVTHTLDLPAEPAGCRSGCHRLPGTCNSKGPEIGRVLEHICPEDITHLPGNTAHLPRDIVGTAGLLATGREAEMNEKPRHIQCPVPALY